VVEVLLVSFSEIIAEAKGFFAKDQGITGLDWGFPKRFGGAGREEEAPFFWEDGTDDGVDVGVDLDVHVLPVVESCASESLFANVEAKGLDQVQLASCGEAHTGDIACIRRNFWFDQDDMEWWVAEKSVCLCGSLNAIFVDHSCLFELHFGA
jgi:hypothetical protein